MFVNVSGRESAAPSRSASALAASGEALLEFRQVTKQFGSVSALADVSLRIRPGDFFVLLGPSGSGKSTLLRCAAGIERVTSGAIVLDGATVDDGRRQVPPERRDLAMVFQDYALWPHLTARQNVAYALRRRRFASAEADRLVVAMLGRVGLGALADRYPSELSGGEQQRVALARALVASPRLLLFDEPLSNLDATLRERMRIEIASLAREAGTTSLYITHDQSEALALADQIGVMERGRLVQVGTPEDIYLTPATPFVARLTGLAGEIRGVIQRLIDRDQAVVSALGAELTPLLPGPIPPGAAARVLVRPAAVVLLAPSHPDARLPGVVRDTAFSGRGYEHVVELTDGSALTSVFSEQRWERGDNVGLAVRERGCIAFADEVRG